MEKKNDSQLKLRIWILFGTVFLIGFTVLIVQLFKIQIIEGEMYKSRALRDRSSSVSLGATRGKILDRNEKILAQSAIVWDVCISPAEIKEEQWAIIAKNLALILEIPEENILKFKGQTNLYEKVKSGVDSHTRESILSFVAGETKITGIFFREAPKRYYTYDSLASNLIGFTDYDHHGAYGLEARYDSILSGTPGVDVFGTDMRSSNTGGGQSYKAQDGYSIKLTIDETVQSSLEKHLEMAYIEHNVQQKVSGVFMDIETGEILAMADFPNYNPNSPFELTNPSAEAKLEGMDENSEEYKEVLTKLWYDQWRNNAVSDAYEPGSVYKIVTASIALEEQNSFLGDYFYCPGFIVVADRKMNCWRHSGHGEQDFFKIMQNSCNPAFVTLGLRNGATATTQYMRDFGFGQITGIDLPAEAPGILHNLVEGRPVELASTSFGQSFKATPIQVVTAVSAAVNGGYLVEPFVVKQIMDADGNVVETIPPKVKRQVISQETSAEIRQLVEGVVSNGSGRAAAIPGYSIGGKTGTSEKLDLLPRKEYVLSFVGFAPMEKPKYALLVMIDEPRINNPLGSVIAAPVVGAIFQETLPYLGVEAHYTAEELARVAVDIPYLIGEKPHDAQAKLTAMGIKTKIVGQGQAVLHQVPQAGEKVLKGEAVTLYCSEDELNPNISMPDLTGLSGETAKAKLREMGLNVLEKGLTTQRGAVVGDQWPLPGEKVKTADIVSYTLVEDTGKDKIETLPEIEGNPSSEPTAPSTPSTDPTPVAPVAPDFTQVPVVKDPIILDPPVTEPDPEPEPPKIVDPPLPPKGATGEELDG